MLPADWTSVMETFSSKFGEDLHESCRVRNFRSSAATLEHVVSAEEEASETEAPRTFEANGYPLEFDTVHSDRFLPASHYFQLLALGSDEATRAQSRQRPHRDTPDQTSANNFCRSTTSAQRMT